MGLGVGLRLQANRKAGEVSKQLYEIADLEWANREFRGSVCHVAKSPVGDFVVIEHPDEVLVGLPWQSSTQPAKSVEAGIAAANAHNRELMARGLKPVTCNQDPCTGE